MQTGCVFRDPKGKYNGIFWFYDGTINDGKGEIVGKKLFAVYDNGDKLELVNPSTIWDLEPIENPKNTEANIDKNKAKNYIINSIDSYLKELKSERERQAKIKEKYGVKSLEVFIEDLEADLCSLYLQTEYGRKCRFSYTQQRRKEEKLRNCIN